MLLNRKILKLLRLHPTGQDKTLESASRYMVFSVWRQLSELVVLLVMLVFSFYSVFLDITQKCEFEWFQRSGSLLVVTPIILRLPLWEPPQSWNWGERNGPYLYGGSFARNLQRLFSFRNWAVVPLPIYGTVVWGYGDIILRAISACAC